MSLLPASFRGVPFHVDAASESVEWRYQTSEFVTGQKPTTARFAKAPQEFTVDGYLLGKAALLTRDMLALACEDPEPGKLIHPLFGLKDVICVARRVETFGISNNAFRFSLSFREAQVKTSNLLDKAGKEVEKAHAEINRLALAFVGYTGMILQSVHMIDRTAQLITKVDAFITSQSGLGIFPEIPGAGRERAEAVFEAAKGALQAPEVLFEALKKSVGSLDGDPQQSTSAGAVAADISRAAILQEDGAPTEGKDSSTGYVADTVTVLAVSTVADRQDTLPYTFKEPIDDYLSRAGNSPGYDDDEVFAYMWERSLAVDPEPTKPTRLDRPSLVAAFEAGDLDIAEGLANAAEQPFDV